MSIEIKIPKVLAEDFSMVGNCNMETPDEEIKIQGQVPIVYATAINDRKRRLNKIEKDFNESQKEVDKFNQEQYNKTDVKNMQESLKMELNESLFEEVSTALTESNDDELEKMMVRFGSPRSYTTYAEEMISQGLLDPNTVATYALRWMDDDEVREFLEANEMDPKSMRIFDDDGEDFEENLMESPVATAEPKVRKRSKNDSKKDVLDSDGDLWTQIYDDLSADVRDYGPDGVHKQLKAKRGQRYTEVYPINDNDIIIYETSPERFEFAKQVAAHYGVKAEEPKEDKNKASNSYYKYSMIIRIPQDA